MAKHKAREFILFHTTVRFYPILGEEQWHMALCEKELRVCVKSIYESLCRNSSTSEIRMQPGTEPRTGYSTRGTATEHNTSIKNLINFFCSSPVDPNRRTNERNETNARCDASDRKKYPTTFNCHSVCLFYASTHT